jgi:uncharacterized membrane protein
MQRSLVGSQTPVRTEMQLSSSSSVGAAGVDGPIPIVYGAQNLR